MERMGWFYSFFLSSLQFFCKMVQKNPELFVYNFTIYLFSAMLGLCSYAGFSPVVASRAYSLLAVCGLHRGGFFCCRAQALGCTGFSS